MSELFIRALEFITRFRDRLWMAGIALSLIGIERSGNFQGRVDGIAPYLYSPGTEIWDCYMATGRCEQAIAEYQSNSDAYALQANVFRVVMILGISLSIYSLWPRIQERISRR